MAIPKLLRSSNVSTQLVGETKDENENDDSVSKYPKADVVIPFKSNVLQHLNGILYDRQRGRRPIHEAQVRKLALKGNFDRYQPCETTKRFGRRISEISFHPKERYLVGAGDKFGDILLMKGVENNEGYLKFDQCLTMKGSGPGGRIFSLRFNEQRRNIFYTAALDGMVNSFNIERNGEVVHEFYNTGDYNHWFTSMDVSQPTRTLLAGCTKGRVYLSTLDGEKVAETRLHRGKVFHVEFNQVLPHLIVTSSIDKTVKLWDLRKLSENSPLFTLDHEKPVNVAHFNPLDSSRLLTSDQGDEIRIYQGPNWTQSMSIKQPHRQFQHLTPIVASWHPLTDLIVIGKYPVVPKGTKPPPPRPIQFFDADTGNMIHQLFPPATEIVSLNVFSPFGDVLACGQSRSLLFFHQQEHSQVLSRNAGSLKRKHSNDDVRFGQSSDSDDDDDDQDANTKKRKRGKAKLSGKKVKNTTTSSTPKKPRRK